MYRSHTCGELRSEHEGTSVTLSGWVHRRRDHGDLIFVDLRDRYGITQVVFDPSAEEAAHGMAEDIRSEYVVTITGTVRMRPKGQENEGIPTGTIEVLATEVRVLNKAKTPPFEIEGSVEPNEELRLKYRYLDLRRERLKRNILFRHKFIKRARDIFDQEGFIEVETPMLMKGTPEGSREFIVPARLYPGQFYVLPQSPQQLKQLLMVAGMDRYMQIARCFRDEDSRGDRQPEFTQLDLEMSFIEEEDVMAVNERVLTQLLKEMVPHKTLKFEPFPRLTWQEAMSDYGSDKPDLRFDMKIVDVADQVKDSEFQVFTGALQNKGVVKALTVKGGSTFSRKEIDDLTELAKIYGVKGLAYIIVDQEETRSPILKFFKEEQVKALLEHVGAEKGDIVFFAADKFEVACTVLGQIRLSCADKFNLRDPNVLACCWVIDFPLFERNDEGQLGASHHPFTSPKNEHVELLETDPDKALAKAYDIAMNGSEIGGGSIRIHSPEVQAKIFKVLGLTDDETSRRFGHLLEAFQFGAPPHGGIAWGLDRIIMLLLDEPNIREVIAFPKDSKAKDLLTGAPSELPEAAIKEMHIKTL